MKNVVDRLIQAGQLMLPTGRAFRGGEGSNIEKLLRGMATSEAVTYDDNLSIFDSMFPDNNNFTAQDAAEWEARLGLVNGFNVPLEDRKKAIRRKMAAPGINPAKGHYLWLENQLQAAGFNVYVHENIFPTYPSGFTRIYPGDANPALISEVEQGMFEQGGASQGDFINAIVANSVYSIEDTAFDFGQDYGGVFFIGGAAFGTYANVLAVREIEFRQLILGLKQIPTAAVLLINYV